MWLVGDRVIGDYGDGSAVVSGRVDQIVMESGEDPNVRVLLDEPRSGLAALWFTAGQLSEEYAD